MSGVILYRRQSLDKLGDELGIERQLAECERVAQRERLTVTEVITDNDTSASKRGRPGFNRLLKMAAAGHVSTIIILRIDRLLRLNDELEELITAVEKTGLVVLTAEGKIDLSTYEGRLMARILVSVARAEREVKSERHKLANRQKAEKGLPHGARRAYGYESDGMTIKEDEALVLKHMADKFLNGWSYKELAYWLNEEGIPTAQGKLFYPITVRNMLRRKRYAGLREYEGIDYPAVWPPIFDEDTWARIQYTANQRKERAGNVPMARKYLLTGFLYCGKCGAPLNGEVKRDHPGRPLRRTYQCRVQGDTQREHGCGGVTRGAEPLEHFIRELIVYRLDTPDLGRLLDAHRGQVGGIAELINKKAAIEAKMGALLDDYTDGTLTKAEYKRAKARAQQSLDEVAAQIKHRHQSQVVRDLEAGESVRERWLAESDGWRRQLIGMMIERIVVNVGKTKPLYQADDRVFKFDPELIDVMWHA
jgi:DNA invertase Pin-like site-specific DNA recombinase